MSLSDLYWSRRPVRSSYCGVRAHCVSIIHHAEGVALLTTEPEDVVLIKNKDLIMMKVFSHSQQ